MICKPEFPRPDRERSSWLNLNGEWDFKLLPDGKGDDAPGGYDRKINVPFSWTSPLSGVNENVAGVGWYSRKASFEKHGRLFLCVGAADYLCDVYVNGEKVCSHQGGYNEFDIDVTDVWTDGENEITIRCEDYRRQDQTYGKQGYGDIQGIWQTVWLEDRGEQYIESFQFFPKADGEVYLKAKVHAPDGAILTAEFDGNTYTDDVEDGVAEMIIDIDDPVLWSPDDPHLYFGTLSVGGDTVKTYFGIREISTEGGRILLNGEPIYINGTLDQAFNPKGHFTYPSDDDMRLEAWRLKRLGLNMARIHIKAEEPRKLYWMDVYGILIMQDMPCFWGEPDETARSAYENEWKREFERDFNHPCIFAWVMFNETWGLFSGEKENRKYLPETQEWVRKIYREAKMYDPSRIIEDNSVCNYDHVESDINTWHFYINGYYEVKSHIETVVNNTIKGSTFNYIGGNRQNGAPLMNSECGMVWGVDGSAGDSDIAWQYHYMLNEFRLHDIINGFIFTEFHDVVNEFNGYYRIDDTDKDFGYQYYAEGMSVKDMHAKVFCALDCPPCRTVKANQRVDIPFGISNFSGEDGVYDIAWRLWHDTPFGRVIDSEGNTMADAENAKTTMGVMPLKVTMPDEDCAAVLSVYVMCGDEVVSRNFTTFDVVKEKSGYDYEDYEDYDAFDGEDGDEDEFDGFVEDDFDDYGEDETAVRPRPAARKTVAVRACDGRIEGFDCVWTALGDEKLCLGGKGEVSYEFDISPLGEPDNIRVAFEAGAKRVLKKDAGDKYAGGDADFMHGYLVDRGSFPNSYFMTDEDKPISNLEVYVNGRKLKTVALRGDNADSRGMLSWHYQRQVRKLDEAGSYGRMVVVDIPSDLLGRLDGKFTLTLKADNGLALYGRRAGRYGIDICAAAY